jgi:hypothetical protein
MRIERVLFGVLVVAAGAYALALAFVVVQRLPWPYEIEWMEGGELMHALRLTLGQGIYVPPSADFVPFFYTPLYPALLAGFTKLGVSLGFPLARAVSALATLATLVMLYDAGAREAGRLYGLLAACLYASLFRFAGAFYDVARPDSLEIALIMGAALVARRAEQTSGTGTSGDGKSRAASAKAAFAGLLLCAAFLTKQTAAVFGPPIALCLFLRNRRLGVLFAAVGAGTAGIAAWALTRVSAGWFWFYVFQGHQGHRFLWGNILLEYWRDVLFLAPMLLLFPLFALSYGRRTRWIALALAVLFAAAFIQRVATLDYPEHMYYRELWYEARRPLLVVPPLALALLLGSVRFTRAWSSPVPGYWLVLAAAGAVASGLNHSTQWAYANCFMPIALFGSLAIAFVLKSVSVMGKGPLALAATAGIVQMVALAYNPLAQIPLAKDKSALKVLVRRVAELPKPVFIPSHPFLAYELSGKQHLHQMGIGDVAFAGGIADLSQRLARGEWKSVIVDDNVEVPDLERAMYLSDTFPYDGPELYPKTGFVVRPLWVWRLQDRTARDLAPGITGNFEGGTYRGWATSGEGFGQGPTPSRRLGGLRGLEGGFAASSRLAPSGGTLESAPFVLSDARVTFLVAGGVGSYVRALHDQDEIARVQPTDAESVETKSLLLDRWVGQTIRIQIVDSDASSRAAHRGIVVDDFRVVP